MNFFRVSIVSIGLSCLDQRGCVSGQVSRVEWARRCAEASMAWALAAASAVRRVARATTSTPKRVLATAQSRRCLKGSKIDLQDGGEAAATSTWPQTCKDAWRTFLVYLGANGLSNAMIHPFQKLDYGALSPLFMDGRIVENLWWGTRLEHLIMVPALLTICGGFADAFWKRIGMDLFGIRAKTMSFATTPNLYLVNLYAFTFCAVWLFFFQHSRLNPDLEGNRCEFLSSKLKPLATGMGLQWHAPLMLELFRVGKGRLNFLRETAAIAFIFLPVKALGFEDFQENGLSPHERKLNNLSAV